MIKNITNISYVSDQSTKSSTNSFENRYSGWFSTLYWGRISLHNICGPFIHHRHLEEQSGSTLSQVLQCQMDVFRESTLWGDYTNIHHCLLVASSPQDLWINPSGLLLSPSFLREITEMIIYIDLRFSLLYKTIYIYCIGVGYLITNSSSNRGLVLTDIWIRVLCGELNTTALD